MSDGAEAQRKRSMEGQRTAERTAKVNILSLRLEPPYTTSTLIEHMRIFEMNSVKIASVFGSTNTARGRVRGQLLLETLPQHIARAVNKRDQHITFKRAKAAFLDVAREAGHLPVVDEPKWGPHPFLDILESLRPGDIFPHVNQKGIVEEPTRTATPVAPDPDDVASANEDGDKEQAGAEAEIGAGSDGDSDAVAEILNDGMPIILRLYLVPRQKPRSLCSYCSDIEDDHDIDDCPDKASGTLPRNRLALAVYNNPHGTIPAELDFGLFIQAPAADRFGNIETATIFLAPYTTTEGQVHVVRDYSLLINPQPIYAVSLKRIGSNEVVRSSLKGSVILHFGGYWCGSPDGGAGIVIHDVYYVPDAPCNALSIHALGDQWKVFDNQRLLQGPNCEAMLARFPNGLLAAQLPAILGPNDNLSPPPEWNTQSSFCIGYARETVADKGKMKDELPLDRPPVVPKVPTTNKKKFTDRPPPPHLDRKDDGPVSRVPAEAADVDMEEDMVLDTDEETSTKSVPSQQAAAPKLKPPSSPAEIDGPTPALMIHTTTGTLFSLKRCSTPASFSLDPTASHHVVRSDKFTSTHGEAAPEVTFSSQNLHIPPTMLNASSTVILSERYDPKDPSDIIGVEIPDVYFADGRINGWLNILSEPLLTKQGWVVNCEARVLRHPKSGVSFEIQETVGMDFVLVCTWQLE
ncbi:uncharacterized protein LOC62_06G008018 [Vanrija pseudolonga]|uniref:Uncharacterized protein n=1 Tax=Vanrija pseudolonga TaxID=143232 RepID=A0AAF0YGB7_9TREE|nr:hypothetical protein LOC62_06G008018 [Vanrija pseudolonga]